MRIVKVQPRPGQSMEDALRTTPGFEVDDDMFRKCPKAIISLDPPGHPESHYRSDGTCRCDEDRRKKDELRFAEKVGWCVSDSSLSHLVVRPRDPKAGERTACGYDVELLSEQRSRMAMSSRCVKCRNYAAKRRWV